MLWRSARPERCTLLLELGHYIDNLSLCTEEGRVSSDTSELYYSSQTVNHLFVFKGDPAISWRQFRRASERDAMGTAMRNR